MKKLFTFCFSLCLATYLLAGGGDLWLVPQSEDDAAAERAVAPRQMAMGCPSFPGAKYASIDYNVGVIPWRLEFSPDNESAYFGDTAGATVKWYRYKNTQTKAQAVQYNGPGSNTITNCFPATDESNSVYNYYCVVTKPGCSKVESPVFDVHVGEGDPCKTFLGKYFRIITYGTTYQEGATFRIEATTNAYGGNHQYVWYHNGEPIDTTNYTKYEFTWGFNEEEDPASLTIKNATPADGGTYSVSMQDGTECFMYTDPVRITIGSVTCGTIPTISAQKTGLGEGETTTITVSNATLAADETGEFVFMLKPEGSNPQITGTSLSNMTFTPDMAGTYNIKYVINNSANASCFRESKVVSIVVYACGPQPTITPDKTLIPVGNTVVFTTTGLGDFETGKITYQKEGTTTWKDAWPADRITFYDGDAGENTVKYAITNSKAPGCNREVTTTVRVYSCKGVDWLGWDCNWLPKKQKMGETITPNPPQIKYPHFTYKFFYTIDGGKDTVWLADRTSSITFDQPGQYKVEWIMTHEWTDQCVQNLEATFTVESCGTKATISSNKTVMKMNETATLTMAQPASGETKSLTYSKDGGAAQTVTLSGNTYSFKPTATGVYTFTYTITKSGCGSTSASVTVEVYDCGQDATLSLSDSEIILGKSVQITTSPVGSHETGVLTYSLNGGTPVPITSDNWIPTAAGTYTLKWAITHAYIDCARDASAVVNVYACGPDAAVSTTKNVLKTGEPTTITTSALGDHETGVLTCSFNGGASVPVSAGAWTPAETGVYVFTWSITNDKIDCARSAACTVEVYACGPEATLSVSASEVKLDRNAVITVSEVGDYETGSLTYSLNGAAPVPVSAGMWTPHKLGTYVFTWAVTNSKVDCSRSATYTVTVIPAELIFDDSNGTHVWSDPKNWYPEYTRVPFERDSGIVIRPCNVDIADARIEYLYLKLDNSVPQPALTILPQGALTVVKELQNVQTEQDILVRADRTGNGVLVLGPDNVNIPATVQYYSLAQDGAAKDPVWQYIGYPLQNRHLKKDIFTAPDTRFYVWTDTPNEVVGGNWGEVDDSYALPPFEGMCLTQDKQTLYTYRGTLCDPLMQSLPLSFADAGAYPRFRMLANSWVAPIDITRMETADFGSADATVYIMNTGTFMEAFFAQTNMSQGTAKGRGQYNAIPVHAASYLPNSLTVIPPMQGFFVYSPVAGSTTVQLDYTKDVYETQAFRHSVTPLRTPKRAFSSPVAVLQLTVENNAEADKVYLLQNDGFTDAFDNGWDGRQIMGETQVHLGVATSDGVMSVAALNNWDDVPLVFSGHRALNYTFTVQSERSYDGLYLLDRKEGAYTPLAAGATYTFKATNNDGERFIITRKPGVQAENISEGLDLPFKFIWNNHMYIRQSGVLYDAAGHRLYH